MELLVEFDVVDVVAFDGVEPFVLFWAVEACPPPSPPPQAASMTGTIRERTSGAILRIGFFLFKGASCGCRATEAPPDATPRLTCARRGALGVSGAAIGGSTSDVQRAIRGTGGAERVAALDAANSPPAHAFRTCRLCCGERVLLLTTPIDI